eukprot:15649013-Heterocapsa_arctica.AAC.1
MYRSDPGRAARRGRAQVNVASVGGEPMTQAPVAAGLDVVVGEDVPLGGGLALAGPSGKARHHAVD